jgi:mRNA-degrading endonuclease RelE of RelBE toxin-antitoxin system
MTTDRSSRAASTTWPASARSAGSLDEISPFFDRNYQVGAADAEDLTREVFRAKLMILANNPAALKNNIRRISGPEEALYRLRIGSYRVIFLASRTLKLPLKKTSVNLFPGSRVFIFGHRLSQARTNMAPKMRTLKGAPLVLALIGWAAAANAAVSPVAAKIYTTHHVNPHAPVIDGRFDDPAWAKVEWAGDFVQRDPYEGKAPTQPTAFKILYDDKNIYVAIRAYDNEPDKVVRRLARRDTVDGDWVEIQLDSYHDHLTAFSFMVNAAGVKSDMFLSSDGNTEDSDWNPIWDVATALDAEGWTAELKIPFSQVRYAGGTQSVWGIQVQRKFFRAQETSFWQFIPRDASGWVHCFGELQGLEGLRPQRQVELTPYSVGRAQTFRPEPGNPFRTGNRSSLFGGLDGKVGVTSDLTMDFTINPDFGQVEADPSVVNLTAFETYYEEKRPFFIEGRNILSFKFMGGDGDFSQDNLFYSRRIGRYPQRELETQSGEYVDMPENTRIIGAFKLTGKTRSGVSIGVIDAVTAAEYADLSFSGLDRREPVEPFTNYLGLRFQKDYRRGDTVVGGMITAVNRNLNGNELDFLHREAYAGGFDISHSWKNRTYTLSFKTAFSLVRGSEEAILQTQLSSLHHFQRPDADYVKVDPTRRSLGGHAGTLTFDKSGSGHLSLSTGVTWRSPGFEINDMGYTHYADVAMQYFWAGYRIWKPFSIFREVQVNFNEWIGANFGGQRTFTGGNVNFWGIFKNYWQFGFGINRQFPYLSDWTLRGGPSFRTEGGWNYWGQVRSDTRRKLQYSLMGGIYQGDLHSMIDRSLSVGVTYQASNALALTLSPQFEIYRPLLQWVTQLDFGGATRYIMAGLDQTTVGMTVRLNWSLTPDLSIQYYGMPYVSAGAFKNFKRISDPRAARLEDRFHVFGPGEISLDTPSGTYNVDEDGDGRADYSFDNPNFNFLQFRSNLVVRWEYRPGSVLYLVWSQDRTGFDTTGEFAFGPGVRNLFNVHPGNVFLIKFSYCFNL